MFPDAEKSMADYLNSKELEEKIQSDKEQSKQNFYSRIEELTYQLNNNSHAKHNYILVELYLKYLTKLFHSICGLVVSLNSEIDFNTGQVTNSFRKYELFDGSYIDLFFSDYEVGDRTKKLYFKGFSPLEVIQSLRNKRAEILEKLKEVMKTIDWQILNIDFELETNGLTVAITDNTVKIDNPIAQDLVKDIFAVFENKLNLESQHLPIFKEYKWIDKDYNLALIFEIPKGLPGEQLEGFKLDFESQFKKRIFKIESQGNHEVLEIQVEVKPREVPKVIAIDQVEAGAGLQIPIGINLATWKSDYLDFNNSSANHLFLIGTAGSGKSSWLNYFIFQIMRQNSPEDVKFLFIDLEGTEFQTLDDPSIAYTLAPLCSEYEDLEGYLDQIRKEARRRKDICNEYKFKNIKDYQKAQLNNPNWQKVPTWFIIIDEFGATSTNSEDAGFYDFESKIGSLAQTSRKYGIHLVIATQEIMDINRQIKANSNFKIAFRVEDKIESELLFDESGAEKLEKGGFGLVKIGNSPLESFKSPFFKDEDLQLEIESIKAKYPNVTNFKTKDEFINN